MRAFTESLLTPGKASKPKQFLVKLYDGLREKSKWKYHAQNDSSYYCFDDAKMITPVDPYYVLRGSVC